MRLLWLTTDRSRRVADIFTPLQREVAKLVEVEFVTRDAWTLEEIWGHTPFFPLVDPYYANEFDLVFTDAPFAFMTESWEDISAPKALLMEDQHGPLVQYYIGRCVDEFGFTHFFTRYRDPLVEHHPLLARHHVRWLPHCIEPEGFHDMRLERSIGVLSTGRLNPETYPFRDKVHRALVDTGYYHRIGRPEEGTVEDTPAQRLDYATHLNRARISVQGTSRYNYVTRKSFEIPACGTVLLTDWIPEMEDLGFRPGRNCWTYGLENTAGQIRDGVEALLSLPPDDSLLHQIADAGHDLVHARHTAEARAREFVVHAQEIINGWSHQSLVYNHAG